MYIALSSLQINLDTSYLYVYHMLCFQIHHEARLEEEKEKQFVAQAFAGSMKHGGCSKRGSTKPDDWPSRWKGDRDRRDKDRDRERERDRDQERDKPKEKLDARKLMVLLKHREKKDLAVHTYSCLCVECVI